MSRVHLFVLLLVAASVDGLGLFGRTSSQSVLNSIPKRRFAPPVVPNTLAPQQVGELEKAVGQLESATLLPAADKAEKLLVAGQWRVAFSSLPECACVRSPRPSAPSYLTPLFPSDRAHVDVPSGYVAGAVYMPWMMEGASLVQARRSILCKKLGPEKVERQEKSTERRRAPADALPPHITYLDRKLCVERTRAGLLILEQSRLPAWFAPWGGASS